MVCGRRSVRLPCLVVWQRRIGYARVVPDCRRGVSSASILAGSRRGIGCARAPVRPPATKQPPEEQGERCRFHEVSMSNSHAESQVSGIPRAPVAKCAPTPTSMPGSRNEHSEAAPGHSPVAGSPDTDHARPANRSHARDLKPMTSSAIMSSHQEPRGREPSMKTTRLVLLVPLLANCEFTPSDNHRDAAVLVDGIAGSDTIPTGPDAALDQRIADAAIIDVGGTCTYRDTPGLAIVTEIRTAASTSYNCYGDAVEVLFNFVAGGGDGAAAPDPTTPRWPTGAGRFGAFAGHLRARLGTAGKC